jgi:hypothetical protein
VFLALSRVIEKRTDTASGTARPLRLIARRRRRVGEDPRFCVIRDIATFDEIRHCRQMTCVDAANTMTLAASDARNSVASPRLLRGGGRTKFAG